ncbi:FeoB-associated Cys-rich membrane protein [Desulfococcaceae bacterium HSG9]|nr:FeoB-associated Cys-rich membrane protein [Desulfococcaceae bacterium HSG9]
MEGLIVFAIVGLAAAYIGVNFYKKFNSAKTGTCDGGCCSCSMNKPSVSIQKRMEKNDCH